jgi:hypothetical protein
MGWRGTVKKRSVKVFQAVLEGRTLLAATEFGVPPPAEVQGPAAPPPSGEHGEVKP